MSEIYVDEELLREDAERILGHIHEILLPDLETTIECNLASMHYYQSIYNQLQTLLSVYADVLCRDVGLITDIAIAFVEYDFALASLEPDEHWFSSVPRNIDASRVTYESISVVHDNSCWYLSHTNMYNVLFEIISKLDDCQNKLRHMRGYIHRLCYTEGFSGDAAYASLRYFNYNHSYSVNSLLNTIQTVKRYIGNHYYKYTECPFLTENADYGISKEELTNIIRSLNDTIDTMNTIEPTIVDASNDVRLATQSEYDYSALLPNNVQIIEKCNEAILTIDTILDYVDETEEVYFSSQIIPDCESVLSNCFEIIQSLVTHVAQRSDYAYPPLNLQADSLEISARDSIICDVTTRVNGDTQNSTSTVVTVMNQYTTENDDGPYFFERARNYLGVDSVGAAILLLYCTGYGDTSGIDNGIGTWGNIWDQYYNQTGHSNALYLSNNYCGEYMMSSEILTWQVRREIDQYMDPNNNMIAVGDTLQLDYSTDNGMQIENGESINGHQFLHGTVEDAGGFHISGTIYRESEYVYVCNLTYTWNDQIDANASYTTDSLKNTLVEFLTCGQASPYDIHITWSDCSVIDLSNPSNSTGWLRTPAADFEYYEYPF